VGIDGPAGESTCSQLLTIREFVLRYSNSHQAVIWIVVLQTSYGHRETQALKLDLQRHLPRFPVLPLALGFIRACALYDEGDI